jgi:hypothetical protein
MPPFETGITTDRAGGRKIISSFLDTLLQGACKTSTGFRCWGCHWIFETEPGEKGLGYRQWSPAIGGNCKPSPNTHTHQERMKLSTNSTSKVKSSRSRTESWRTIRFTAEKEEEICKGAWERWPEKQEENDGSMGQGGRQVPWCSEWKREEKEMKIVESLILQNVWLSREGEKS